MKVLRFFLVLLLLGTVLLSACQTNTPTPPDTQPSTETIPSSLTTDPANSTESVRPVVKEGTLLTAPLEVVSWEDRRTADSSCSILSETEAGFYMQQSHILYYADKTDTSNWVPLCSKPDCDHPQDPIQDASGNVIGCDAYIGSSCVLKGDRIYYITCNPSTGIPKNDLFHFYVASMSLTGTDHRIEYYHEALEQQARTFGGGGNQSITLDLFFAYLSSMNEDGTYSCNVYVRDESGEYTIPCGEKDEQIAWCTRVNGRERLYGDFCYYIGDLDNSFTMVYRVKDRELYGTELADLPITGGYLEGNNLRCFYPNDGYYDVDLTTRELTHLADAQLENSQAFIMQHNCILETTLTKDREPGSVDTHQLRFFDGQQWHEIALPEELAQAGDPLVYGKYYQILLGQDTYTLEHMVTFE